MAEEEILQEDESLVILTDDDGTEYRFEQLDYLQLAGSEYVALLPYDEDVDEGEEGQLVIMKIARKNNTDTLFFIEDDEEFNRVSDAFIQRLSEDYDIQGGGDDIEVIS